MVLRILVDENTSPRIARHLREADHEAVHVLDAIGEEATDDVILSFAAKQDFAILTHDDDFLKHQPLEAPILYYSDDTAGTTELARKVLRLAGAVRSNKDLAEITYLGEW